MRPFIQSTIRPIIRPASTHTQTRTISSTPAPTSRPAIKSPLFDTYTLAQSLQSSGMSATQSISLTHAIHTLLTHSSSKMRDEILLKPDVHNAEYYRNKYSQELRSELDMLRHNEMALLRTDIDAISRIVEGVAQKTSEKISNLKAEISMDVNKHKAEGKEGETITDLRIQGIHHKLTVELSALKARIEALKMEATQRAIWVALITFASVLVSSILVE